MVSLLALKLARALAQRVAPLGLTVTDAVNRLLGVRLVCLGDAELGLWRLAASYPAAQTEVLAVLPKLAAPPVAPRKTQPPPPQKTPPTPRQSLICTVSSRGKICVRKGENKPEQRVAQLRAGRKQFLDISKLIAYPAESALVSILREKMSRHAARSRVRGLLASTSNLRPDATGTELRIELHGQANPAHDAPIEHLGAELNRTETHYPGTTLRLHFTTLRSATFPRGQDV